ncbi:MAG TPA: hypothetical protein VMD30_01830 [Tepidisphaeraceae bacterium]|nr:hypothetical protein [Tepidisphaeraceae bacterium]
MATQRLTIPPASSKNGNGHSEPVATVPTQILVKARAEMDRTIDRQVEPYRQKIQELERRRADIDEELKGLYMIVGFYDSVRMQSAKES